jgi:hypothetical protein
VGIENLMEFNFMVQVFYGFSIGLTKTMKIIRSVGWAVAQASVYFYLLYWMFLIALCGLMP